MTEKNVFDNNGVWIRWLVSVLISLSAVGTMLFYMGKWTEGIDSKIEAIIKDGTLTSVRVTKLEMEGSPTIQKQVLILGGDMSYIKKALEDNGISHKEIIMEMKILNKKMGTQ